MIKRYFSEENFDRLQSDLRFLIPIIRSYRGELELSFRDNYFNLYFRGNSAAKVVFKTDGNYRIEINEKFYPSGLKEDRRFSSKVSGNNYVIETSLSFLHPLLQKRNLSEIYAKIKSVNYSEELIFEQMLITDNADRADLILIDRQVTDPDIVGRMDLLALKQQRGNQYHFLVLEVKMGNNPELKEDVAFQLKTYIDHITEHFEEYKSCYEKNYSQKRKLGLLKDNLGDSIEIVPPVEGMIIVGGYSGLAKENIQKLKGKYPQIKVQTFFYDLKVA